MSINRRDLVRHLEQYGFFLQVEARLGAESRAARQTPENLIAAAIEQYLEDLEDYRGAVRIFEEVRSGRMETYSLEDVRVRLGLGS